MSDSFAYERTVVFDTNAYRILANGLSIERAREKARLLRRMERGAGCFVLANPIVVGELLAHLADPGDPGYSHCMAAAVALAEHTMLSDSLDAGIGLLADSFSTVCQTLFNRPPLALKEALERLGSLVTHVAEFAPDLSDPTAKSNFDLIARWMDSIERQWMLNMTTVLSGFAPCNAQAVFGGSNDSDTRRLVENFLRSEMFFKCWSAFIVADHAMHAQLSLPGRAEGQRLAGVVREAFATPFYLMRALLLKMQDPRFKLTSRKRKRWNFACDSSIAFALGPGAIASMPLFLVTGDKAIFEAAREAGVGHQVVSLTAYLQSIGTTVALN